MKVLLVGRHARRVDLRADDLDGLLAFAESERIDLTVVGPEAPLVAGLADRLAGRGLAVFGPSGRAAAIEGSTAFAKAIADGREVVALAAAQDHKTVFDDDRGPNTGGMGSFSPAPSVDGAMRDRVMASIVRPAIEALRQAGAPYRGVLYVGLMLTSDGPKVFEFNCRFGDPECQAILARAPGDLVPLMAAVARGKRLDPSGGWSIDWVGGAPGQAAVCVMMASGGYPGAYRTGFPITGIERAESMPGVHVFHAGTAVEDGRLVTAGGRVLGVTAVAPDLPAAIERAYAAAAEIHFEGMHYRRDIGRRRRAGKGS